MAEAFAALRERRVSSRAARRLAEDHTALVAPAIEVYDAGLADGSIEGPGWLISTIPVFVPPVETSPDDRLRSALPSGVAPSRPSSGPPRSDRTPEKERGEAQTAAILRDPTPPAHDDVVARAMAQAEAAHQEGLRIAAERRTALAEARAAGRPTDRPTTIADQP